MATGDRSDRPDVTLDLLDDLTAIRGRAQATRRRIERVDHLSREHIAADLAQIEARVDAMTARLLEPANVVAPPAEPTEAESAGLDASG